MSLISKEHLRLTIQAIQRILSFKADKNEVINKNEVEVEDALAIVTSMELVSPAVAEDGSMYTDENGAVYSL